MIELNIGELALVCIVFFVLGAYVAINVDKE